MIINKLKDISIYVNEKIDNKNLNCTNYIGVDNMLPNCAGITLSNYVPNTGKSTKFKKGDILIGNIRPYFKKIWLATFTGGCSPDVLVIRCNNTNDSKFVYAALANDNFFNYDMAGAKGSKMPRGDKSHIMNYEINFVHNYDRIGEILFNINNQIKRNNDMVQKLQDLGNTIYSKNIEETTSFFTINENKIKTGKQDANFATPNGQYKFFTCSEDSFLCDNYEFEGKNILIAGNGNFNVKFYDGKFNAYQRTYIINDDEIFGNLYYTYNYNTQLLLKGANGSIIKFMTIGMLKDIQIPYFSKETNNLLNNIVLKISEIKQNTDKLNKLKQQLLPLLINGQIIV